MRLQALGLLVALGALTVAAPSTPNSGSLEAAVEAFNARAASRDVGRGQPLLTSEAVVAAIRWSQLPSSELQLSDATRQLLDEVTVTRVLPDSFTLEALTSYEPDGATVFTVWSVRLSIPGGPAPAVTTCIRIQERMIDSRIMGPAELALVQEHDRRQQAGLVGGFGRQRFLEQREAAIAADREK